VLTASKGLLLWQKNVQGNSQCVSEMAHSKRAKQASMVAEYAIAYTRAPAATLPPPLPHSEPPPQAQPQAGGVHPAAAHSGSSAVKLQPSCWQLYVRA
jgi:hypothetical protein